MSVPHHRSPDFSPVEATTSLAQGEAIEAWQAKSPESFLDSVNNHTGLDNLEAMEKSSLSLVKFGL